MARSARGWLGPVDGERVAVPVHHRATKARLERNSAAIFQALRERFGAADAPDDYVRSLRARPCRSSWSRSIMMTCTSRKPSSSW